MEAKVGAAHFCKLCNSGRLSHRDFVIVVADMSLEKFRRPLTVHCNFNNSVLLNVIYCFAFHWSFCCLFGVGIKFIR